MRTTTATTCLAIGLAILFAAPGDDAARAVEGDLSKKEKRPIVRMFNQVVKDHRGQVNSHRKFFAQQQKQIVQNIGSNTLDPFFVASSTASALDTTFNTAISDTRSAIEDLEDLVLDFYDDNQGAPDSVLELSGDIDSLIAAAIAKLNANNNRFASQVERSANKLEKKACAKNLFLDIDIFGMPEFVAPQFDRIAQAGSGEARHRANIIYTFSGNNGTATFLNAFGYADIDDDDEFWWGLFEPDGTEFDTQSSTSPVGNGTFRAAFSGFTPGAKNLAIDIFDPDDGGLIFADGFESGDTSAWSYTRP